MKERISDFLENLLENWPWKYYCLLLIIMLFILIFSLPFDFAKSAAIIVGIVVIITTLPLIIIWSLLFLLNFNELDW